MGRQPGTSKTCHRTERVLRRISMLLRLHRIKARMATITSSSNSTSSSAQPAQPQRLPQPHPQNLVPLLPAQYRPRTSTSSSSSQHRLPEVSLSSLQAMLQRSGRASLVFPQLLRVESTSRDSKRSLRFSHRRRHSQQMQRQLERQAGSEQPTRPPRVRVVAVVMVPHPHAPSSTAGGSSRTSGQSSRRRRTSSSRSQNRMASLPGRPHVLNLVRRMLVPMVVDREARTRRNQDNVRRILVQEQQAPTERTPEKGNRNGGGGDVDDKKRG